MKIFLKNIFLLLAVSNLIFSQQHIDFKKQIGDAEQFQKLAPTDIELRKCLQAMAFQPQLFKNKLDGNNLIKFVVEWIESIEKVTQQKASSQLMYIVGECRTTTKDRDEHPGVHAFGIYFDVDVNEIKWFEANRGEVAFKHPKNFIAWLQHEFDQGELKVLNKRHKIQEDEYRQYISFEAYTFIGIPHCQPERQLEHLPQARL